MRDALGHAGRIGSDPSCKEWEDELLAVSKSYGRRV